MSRNPSRAPASRIGAVAQKPTHNDNNVAPTQNPLLSVEEEKEKIRSVAPTIFLFGLAIGVGIGVGGSWIFCKIFKKDPVAVLEKALEATY